MFLQFHSCVLKISRRRTSPSGTDVSIPGRKLQAFQRVGLDQHGRLFFPFQSRRLICQFWGLLLGKGRMGGIYGYRPTQNNIAPSTT